LGQPDGLARKLQLFKALLGVDPHLPDKALYLDLSAPEAPALMPREPVVASDSVPILSRPATDAGTIVRSLGR